MNIDNEIQVLIDKLRQEYKIPAYLHNDYKNFVPEVTPVYYSGPYYDDREVVASVKAMLTGKWMSAGENVRKFEKEFSLKTKNLFSNMVNSGSSANLVMIASLKEYFGWDDNDEIIVSVVGFPTTVAPIVQNGLVPVFIDIEMDTLNFDLNKIEEKITDRTKAIFLSPVLGNPPDIYRLITLCSYHNLELILDNCDSLGSKWDGKYLNEYAIASSCSFYPAHEICTFEGGMISSDKREIINIARKITNWGRDCICSGIENLLPNGICNRRFDTWIEDYADTIDHKYVFSHMGYNLKPLDVTGAVGLVQLEKLGEICKKRNDSKNIISQIFLSYVEGIKIPETLRLSEPTWFGTPIICENKKQKRELVEYLEKNKIQTRNYFAGNILLHSGYKHLGNHKKYPIANEIYDRVFFVGASPSYNKEVFDYIYNVVEKLWHP